MMNVSIRNVLVASLALGLPSAAAMSQSSFTPLGDLPGRAFVSSASGVSSFDLAGGDVANLVVSGNAESGRGREAFRWTLAEGMLGLGDLGGAFFFSSAAGISADGTTIVGAASGPDGILAHRWREATGMISLGDLAGGSIQSEAGATNADGDVVVGASRSISGPLGDEAFAWTPGTGMTGLGRLAPGASTQATAVSADGSVAAGYGSADGEVRQPFRWTASSGLEPLPLPLGDVVSGEAQGMTPDGATIVGWVRTDAGQSAIRWTDAGLEVLQTGSAFGESRIFTRAVSEDGSIIVGWAQDGAELRAFIWTQADGMRPLQEVLEADFGLDLSGWTLTLALDATVHADTGRVAIVGAGLNPDGQTEAYIAVLDPAPPCAVDLDGDGDATVFDFLIFLNRFQDGNLGADFDGDGVLTIFDFLRYFDAFDIGCP
ncbi:MAG: GC-type dockerin domain-anchored protein [Phycisphaerales bacterium]